MQLRRTGDPVHPSLDRCRVRWHQGRRLHGRRRTQSIWAYMHRQSWRVRMLCGDVNPQAIIARVNFFGWSLGGRRSLGEFFVNNLSEGKNVNGFTDVIFCPMWVNHLSSTLLEMLERKLNGLYHVVGAQAMSKYQFGMEIARRFGLRKSLIAPQSVESSSLTVPRSHNLWLSIHKLYTELGHEIPPFSTGLDGFYTQLRQDYPQKIRSYQQP